jgi:hypothetical protein
MEYRLGTKSDCEGQLDSRGNNHMPVVNRGRKLIYDPRLPALTSRVSVILTFSESSLRCGLPERLVWAAAHPLAIVS